MLSLSESRKHNYGKTFFESKYSSKVFLPTNTFETIILFLNNPLLDIGGLRKELLALITRLSEGLYHVVTIHTYKLQISEIYSIKAFEDLILNLP